MSGSNNVAEDRLAEHNQRQSGGDDELAVELGRLARDLQQQTPEDILAAIVQAAGKISPG